ncbi:glycoside hydrolase family 28 protein [Lelliottia sp. V106_10]|uniref:glycoside hydrolase family 28 protein n=1 Tax=Lelliottia wanjuensis TaxID=3050585 RepID=UPI00254A9F9D|nr:MULTISPECIES: glycoside hydrolase family 28 protein [unclassified Lelliottia]MDK9357069.1 glycoside hydrolase family 28 protein [Lelliottia sp. V106_16]MDK9372259.1 glycoside hydrolase family 28 protein [Lelliottia sp. V106_10]MDK9599063.1 glycoside hydrolase family 28 protein [Lelliottia sp. V106_5]
MKLSLENVSLDRSGQTPVTSTLQSLIDQLAAAGGGTLVVTPGIYLTGTLVLPSNFTLHLDAGARLLASQNVADYHAAETQSMAELSRMALIYARDARNVTLSGAGCIDGNATAWFASQADDQGYRQPKSQRPRLLVLEGCEQVRITDITLYDSPMWTAHLVSCNHVFIRNITIDNDLTLANTDALDIDSCQHVHISDSYFSAADDGICLKTTAKGPELQQPIYNVTINNCIIRSKSCAIKVGTETFADITHLAVSNCVIFESNRGIGLVSRDGGHFSMMSFSNILFDCRHGHPCHWGKADPVFISVRHRAPDVTPGDIRQVTFSGLSGTGEGAINLHGETPGAIRDITFNGLTFNQQLAESDDQGCYDVRPPCNPERPTGMGLDNAYKVNAETGRAHGVEPYPHGLPAIYAHGVDGLHLHAVTLTRPSPLPAGWDPENIRSSK